MKTTKFAFNTLLLSASLIVSQLQAAGPIDPEKQPLATIGPIDLSNTDLSGNDSKAYRGWFENGNWQGDLIEYNVSDRGVLTTTIDVDGVVSPVQTAGSGGNWSAHVQFAAEVLADADYWDSRKIITRNDSTKSQIPFRWSNLSDNQKRDIDSSVALTDTSNEILNFLRGDKANEGGYRSRVSILGDIVHSNPTYVGAPDAGFSETSYVDFKNGLLNRKARVYVGANDGMLHVFDATTGAAVGDEPGKEVWAYVPSMLFHKLRLLSGTSYAHRYYVDGSITVRDAKLSGDWTTVLIGGLGAGGKGLYTLDVTDPDLTDESTSGKLMDELGPDTPTIGNDVGYIFGATSIVQLNDGEWYGINGNGIGSVNGKAKLLLIHLETGDVTPIDTGSVTADNGLSSPAVIDTDGDGKADIAFAGDVNGDMWKFDLSDPDPSKWKKEYKLFNGGPAQPITTIPDVANHPRGGFQVLFGTGKLYEVADVEDTTVQAIYGVWDKPGSVVSKVPGDLLLQNLSGDITYDQGTKAELVRTYKPVMKVDYSTHNGWYIKLPAGERVLTSPVLRASRLKVTVTNPDGFSNWFVEATFDDGSTEEESIFDLNRDNFLNQADRVHGNNDTDYADAEDIPMAWKRPDGNMSAVTVASLGPGEDTLFLNYLNPPLVTAPEPCSGSCDGGLVGGHMDVDTDSEYKGSTKTHAHEYDIKTNRTYIDYFDIRPPVGGTIEKDTKQVPVDDVITDEDKKFIVLIANADWSPGGILTLGDVSYNVVAYQAMLHKALADWNSTDALEDPNNNPLIHSLKTIRDDVDSNGDDGTLRISFNAEALLRGGLIPSKTGCVKNSFLDPNNRWRSNALTMHLVDADYVKNSANGTKPLDRLRVQDPTQAESGDDPGGSFYERVILSDGTIIKLTNDDGLNGLEGGSTKYEVYGGLTAKDSTSFLYEGTVFWHWNSGDQPDVCWSNTDDYRDEFKKWTNRTAVGYFLEKLAEETEFDTFEELVEYIDDSEASGCQSTATADGGCRDAYEEAQALYVEGMEVFQQGGGVGEEDGYVDGQTGDLEGNELIIPGGVSEGGLTSGPNFEVGRRTWIDILPQ